MEAGERLRIRMANLENCSKPAGPVGPTGPPGPSITGPSGEILYFYGGAISSSANFSYDPLANSGDGKLTVVGGIDPTYIAMTPKTTQPNPLETYAATTFWANSSATNQLYFGKIPLGIHTGVLIVDPTFGDNTNAATNKYRIPFSTIAAAISASSSGDTIFLLPGTYNEDDLTPKTNTCIRGANVQTCIIQRLGATVNTTIFNLNTNCRLEDITITLTSSTSGILLIGVDFSSDASITAKVRTAVINVTYSGAAASTAYGVRSGGTTVTTVNSSSAIRASTINVSVTGTSSIGRGIIMTGPNFFSNRDVNIFCSASSGATDAIGVESTNASALISLKACTVSGTLYDIYQDAGIIQLGYTDLVNATTNGKSFKTLYESATLQSFILGTGLGASSTYYLAPGTLDKNSLPTTPIPIYFNQNVVIHAAVFSTATAIASGTVTFNLYNGLPGGGGTLFLTGTLSSGNLLTRVTNSSSTITTSSALYIQVVTSGLSAGAGNFSVLISQL